MPALIGVLLDFSKAMKEIFFDKIDNNDDKRSIFKVVEEFMTKEHVSSTNKIFVIGFGTKYGTETVDIIGTIQQFQEKYTKSTGKLEYSDLLEQILQILESSGASSIRNWVFEDVISKKIHYSFLALLLDALQTSNEFREKVVSFLPSFCRTSWLVGKILGLFKNYRPKDQEIETMIKELQKYFLEDKILIEQFLKGDALACDFKLADDAVRKLFEGNAIDNDRIRNVLQLIDTFFYGEKKVFIALEKSIEIFQKTEYADFKKYLFVLSNGAPSDSRYIETTASTLERENVKVISCHVSNSESIYPKRLYSKEEKDWENGARFMFKLSSTFKTGILSDIILEESEWSFDNSTQDSKLFVHLYHPNQIHETFNAVILLLCLDGIGSTSLFKSSHKVDIDLFPTCQIGDGYYANTVASVLHSQMQTSLNKSDAYTDFLTLCKEIMMVFGRNGAVIPNILDKFCPQYRMRYEKVDTKQAMAAIASNRPIIAIFSLTKEEWDTFAHFFYDNSTGILTKNELDITKRQLIGSEVQSHGVILTGFESTCLKFMNSWGKQWADNGFFRVQNANVLRFEFYDVFGDVKINQSRE